MGYPFKHIVPTLFCSVSTVGRTGRQYPDKVRIQALHHGGTWFVETSARRR
jgi:hypothetical protein